MIEITGIAKVGGTLTKRISLAPDGSLLSDGSECIMSVGKAWRAKFDTLHKFAGCITSLEPHEAIALGALHQDLPDEVNVVTKSRLGLMNGAAAANNLIARTGDYIFYRPEQSALVLIDIDCKGMPAAVRDRIKAVGGFWAALVAVIPEFAGTARVVRRSTSTGISNADTGEQLPGSNGSHIYLHAQEGGDAERFLRALHDRCWLAGYGWFMVGAGGQLLERSIVDRMVGAPERLVFEGAPVLDPPLLQDLASRQATVTDGAPLDTVAACPPLSVVEKSALRDLHAKDAHRLAPDRAKARGKFVMEQAARIATRTGCTVQAARQTVERQCDGVLLPDVVLAFDDEELVYGRCKAKVMRRPGGDVWINSFAHGQTRYELKHAASAIEAVLLNTPDDQLIWTFVQLAVAGDLDPSEQQILRDSVAKRSGINKRTIDQSIAKARKERDAKWRQDQDNQQAAERRDPRPRIKVPPGDDPWLTQVGVVEEVQGSSRAAEPPGRDVEGERARLRMRAFPRLHLLSTTDNNPDQDPNQGDPQ
jgi:hypothetical protein